MEIELKYSIDDPSKITKIFSDPEIVRMQTGTAKDVTMKAVYYDTPGRELTRKRAALRIRKEGDTDIATLKWGEEYGAGNLYRRKEVNIPVLDPVMIRKPEPKLFDGTEAREVLSGVTQSEMLIPLMEMSFVRKLVKIDTGQSVIEIAADKGDICAGGRSVPVLELELELCSGSEDELKRIGERLASEYGLTYGTESKFARGLALL